MSQNPNQNPNHGPRRGWRGRLGATLSALGSRLTGHDDAGHDDAGHDDAGHDEAAPGAPSSDPRGATTPAPRSTEPAAAPAAPVGTQPPHPLTLDRVATALRGEGYQFDDVGEGEDRELVGRWNENPFWFRMMGGGSVFQVRGRWQHPTTAQPRLSLLQTVNDWNRDCLLPKVYLREDGIVAEVTLSVGHGLTDAQLRTTLQVSLSTSTSFFASLQPPAA